MGTFMPQPMMTVSGVTNKAICMEEPIEALIAASILSFMANFTAITCSAELLTIGSRIKPIKVSVKCHFLKKMSAIAPMRNSAQKATRTVVKTRLRDSER